MVTKTIKSHPSFTLAWLDEALNELSSYPTDPILTDFMKRYGLSTQGGKNHMLNAIRREILYGKTLHFSDLVAYIDELHLWGRQYVILYKLKNPTATATLNFLAELADPKAKGSILNHGHIKRVLNTNICRWVSRNPFLAEVKHQYNAVTNSGTLAFKWVRTRQHDELIKNILTPKQKRSVNFFIINLKDGSAELRIQTLPNRPQQDFDEEVQIYQVEIGKLNLSNYFEVVSIEQVMRYFLLKKIYEISTWDVKTPPTHRRPRGGRTGDTNGRPNYILRTFIIGRRGFRPLELVAFWKKCKQAFGQSDLFFYMYNNNNAIRFNAISDKSCVDDILNKIRSIAYKLPIQRQGDGRLDRIWGKHSKTKRGIRKILLAASVPTLGVLLGLLSNAIIGWVGEQAFELVFRIPFITVEIALYILLLFYFYGPKRLQRWFFLIPREYIIKFLRLFLG